MEKPKTCERAVGADDAAPPQEGQGPEKDLGEGFGARLKEAMEMKGMNAPELGRIVGRTRASIGCVPKRSSRRAKR